MAVEPRFAGTSMRCGDFAFLISVVLLLIVMTGLYIQESTSKSKLTSNLNNSPFADKRDGDDVAKTFQDVIQAGKMRALKPIDDERKILQPVKKVRALLEKLGMGSIPDTRSKACKAQGVSKIEATPLRKYISRSKIGIVIYPSERSYSLAQLKTTLVDVLGTTSSFLGKIRIGLVTSSTETAAGLRESFAALQTNTQPEFHILERESMFEQGTLFKELLSIASADFADYDTVVFLSSGVHPNVGWFEPLMEPLVGNADTKPFIVTPTFGKDSEFESPQRITFNWRLAPYWISQKDDLTENIPSAMFIPQAFAIDRKSDHFNSLVSFFVQKSLNDPTAFDASMYVTRCLGGRIDLAPCSRITMPNGLPANEFDPLMNAFVTKPRLAATWLPEYRNTFEKALGVWADQHVSPASCKSISEVLSTIDQKIMLTIPNEFENPSGLKYFSAKSGATFFPSHNQLRAFRCPYPRNPSVMVRYDTESLNIKLSTGTCVNAPQVFGYVTIASCDATNEYQQWKLLKDGTLVNKGSNKCLMHATDPAAADAMADPITQVLMMQDCSVEDSNYLKFVFNDTC